MSEKEKIDVAAVADRVHLVFHEPSRLTVSLRMTAEVARATAAEMIAAAEEVEVARGRANARSLPPEES